MASENSESKIVPVKREKVHLLLMGRPGSGKSTLVASFPKPQLVLLFDPAGKEQPYLERGIAGEIAKGEHCYYREVRSNANPEQVIIRIEYWGESNPFKPTAYPRFVARTAGLEAEIAKLGWQTVVADTATFFENAARTYSEYGINKEVKDGRQHYAFSAKVLEQHLMMRFPNFLLCNSVVCCHIDDQKDESEEGGVVIRKMAALPGKLPNKMPGGFGEVWRVYYAGDDKAGRPIHLIQTRQRPENSYDCKSLLHVPDKTQSHYEAVCAALGWN